MPADFPTRHADILRRLDDLPMSEHERNAAKSQAALAFWLVDAFCDAVNEVHALFAPPRRHAPR